MLLATITESKVTELWPLEECEGFKTGTLGADLWAPDMANSGAQDAPMASQAERRSVQPRLRTADSSLRLKQRVLRSGNGRGIWRGQFW
jgi:hypothetical protein